MIGTISKASVSYEPMPKLRMHIVGEPWDRKLHRLRF